MTWSLVITCEHAGRQIPRELRSLFPPESRKVLATHRGWDIGALPVARYLAEHFEAPLFFTEISRLVIDTNRSAGHPNLYSSYTRDLPRAQRERIRLAYHESYRAPVTDAITALVKKGRRVFHLSVHSFTPVLNGDVRRAGIGLLYDPRRVLEKRFAARWLEDLEKRGDFLPVRRNYPYFGASDCFVSSLRKVLPVSRYMGFELEMNQKYLVRPPERRRMAELMAASLTSVMP